MALIKDPNQLSWVAPAGRFGAGLSEAEVRRFQAILRQSCGREVDLPEAWSQAIEILSLIEMLLEEDGQIVASTGVRAPRS